MLVLAGTALVAAEIAAPVLERQIDLPHQMGVVRRLTCHVINDRTASDQVLIAVTLVPGAAHAHLIDQSPTFPLGARTVALSRGSLPDAVVAINAGYFDSRFQPVGLCRIAGAELTPLSGQEVLSGVVAITATGAVQLLDRDSVLGGIPTAVQAGPFVIDPGGGLGVRPQRARANRSLIARDDHGRILLLVTGALTLHQVGTILHDHAEVFGMERIECALNLDGGPSTGLSVALDDPAWSFNERGPVRNVLVFSHRKGEP